MGLRGELLRRKKTIAVWGCGYIGTSTLLYYASKGVKGIGVDIDQAKVDLINNGESPVPNLEEWTGFNLKELVEDGLISATTKWEDVVASDEVAVHFVGVNTEKDGKPWLDALRNVVSKIGNANSPLVIVESTLLPGTMEKIVLPYTERAVSSPRRDWFTVEFKGKNLENLPRIYGGPSADVTAQAREVLGIVCKDLVLASDHRTAEIVKATENMLRHIGVVVAQQLADAYPDMDVNEVLRLAGTKWNIPEYYPSIHCGGYCINLSSKYLLEGSKYPERLSILNEVIWQDDNHPHFIARMIDEKIKGDNIGILSLSYLGDVPVDIESPTHYLVKAFKRFHKTYNLHIHDPYFTPEDILEKLGKDVVYLGYPEGLREMDCIILVANHRDYVENPPFEHLREGQIIIDNHGGWEKHREKFKALKIDYHRIGDQGWLSR